MAEYRQNTGYNELVTNTGQSEPEQESEGKGKVGGNKGLPFGLCEKYGISLPENATPRDAWDALAKKGVSPPWTEEGKGQYEDGKHNANAVKAEGATNTEKKEGDTKSEETEKSQGESAYERYSLSNVKSWYLQKFFAGLPDGERYHISVADDLEGSLVGETEKAVRLHFLSDYGSTSYWFPKSVFYTAEEKQEKERKEQADREARYARYDRLVSFAKEKGLPVRNKMRAVTIMQMLKDAGIDYEYK